MKYNISIASTSTNFSAEDNMTVLDSALDAGVDIQYGCKAGVCGACKCKVIHGDVIHDSFNNAVLSEEERKSNYILSCRSTPKGNLTLEIPVLDHSHSLKIFQAKVVSTKKYRSVLVVKLKLPFNQKIHFFAGQYIEVLHNETSRFYSIANAPSDMNEISLHIKLYQGGVLTESLWNNLSPGKIVRFKEPIGNFKVKDNNAPIILACTGTGFAPIKAIYEELIQNDAPNPIYLLWGNRFAEDFYELDTIRQWEQDPRVKIILCTSQENVTGFFNGRVTQGLKTISGNLSAYHVYACGCANMVEDLNLAAINELKLSPENFHSEVFKVNDIMASVFKLIFLYSFLRRIQVTA